MEQNAVPRWASVVGWVGTALILLAYTLNSLGFIDTDTGAGYNLLNLFGAAGVVTVTFFQKSWQPMALNVVWATVALVALFS